MKWCECLGRSIFTAIDDLRQELWRILCRFGQSQGLFPKGTIKQPISSHFSYYICNFLTQNGINSEEMVIYDQDRRIQSKLLYRTVKTGSTYHFFNIDSDSKLQSFSRMVGEMGVVGIQRRRPKVNSEQSLCINDAINVASKIELYVSSSKLRLRVHAFKHQVSDQTENLWLQRQLSANIAPQQTPRTEVQSVRLNSKFDYNNSLFKVSGATENGAIRAVCVWGEQKGEELTFDTAEVVELVNRKRG